MSNRENHPISGLMDVTLQRIHEMADGNSVIGDPIQAANGTVILPVSRVSYGFATGGSDVGSKATRDMFGGGSGAGVSVVPVGFLVVKPDGDVRLLQVNGTPGVADRLERLAADLGIDGCLDRTPEALSGGEQQRVALARALVAGPDVVLADEPTGNLDAAASKAICGLLGKLNATEKSAILVVTHDPVVAAAAKTVRFLKDGAIAATFATEGDPALVSRRYLETYR